MTLRCSPHGAEGRKREHDGARVEAGTTLPASGGASGTGLLATEGHERVQPIQIPNRTALKAIGDTLRGYSQETTIEYFAGRIPITLDQLSERTDKQLGHIEGVLTRPYCQWPLVSAHRRPVNVPAGGQ